MRNLSLLVAFAAFFMLMQPLAAQDEIFPAVPDSLKGWVTKGGIGLNFSQVSLSNWAGGGQNSISLGGLFNYQPTFREGRHTWENGINFAYGVIRQGKGDDVEFRKTDDLINLKSRYSYALHPHWALSSLLDFRTQFATGYNYPDGNDIVEKERISEFMAPGFLLASLGFSYTPKEYFTLTLSPISGKFTFVLDDSLSNAGAFGVTPGEKSRSEFGASLQAGFQKDIAQNVNLASTLLLFGNYSEFNHIDVNWDINLLMKVNKFISATLGTQLIYDQDVIARTQLRNSLTVGLLYNF